MIIIKNSSNGKENIRVTVKPDRVIIKDATVEEVDISDSITDVHLGSQDNQMGGGQNAYTKINMKDSHTSVSFSKKVNENEFRQENEPSMSISMTTDKSKKDTLVIIAVAIAAIVGIVFFLPVLLLICLFARGSVKSFFRWLRE